LVLKAPGANFWLKAVMMILSKVAITALSLCSSEVI
jgi:hypothetical protein